MAKTDYFADLHKPRERGPNEVDYFADLYPHKKAAPDPDEQQLVPGKPTSRWQDAKQWVRERTGLFEPPIEGPQYRGTQPLRELGQAAGHFGAQAASGATLGLADVVGKQITGDLRLSETVDRATGFMPTPREIGAGESARYIAGLSSAGRLARPLAAKLPVRQALQTIMASAATFGGREAAEQTVSKIVADEPFDLEGIHFEAGLGALFGTGEVGIQKLGQFVRGMKSGKALAQWNPPEGAKMTPEEFRTYNRQKIMAEVKAAKKAGGDEWLRVRQKYAGFGQAAEGAKSQAATPGAGQPSVRPPRPATGAPTGKPVAKPLGTIAEKAESVYQETMNRFQSIENLTNRAKALGLAVPPGEDPKLLSRVYLGIEGAAQAALKDQTFAYLPTGEVKPTGEGLLPILNDYNRAVAPIEPKADVRERDLDTYANAQRTLYDLQRKAAPYAKRNIVTEAQVKQAQKDIADLRAKYGDGVTALDNAAKRKTAFRNRILHTLVDAGNLSERQYQDIVAENPHYTPFNRVLEEQPATIGTARGPFTKTRAPLHKIKGSELAVAPTTESDIKNVHRILAAANRNRVARSVAGMMGSFPEEISPVKVAMRPIRVDPSEIKTSTRSFVEEAVPAFQEIREAGPGKAASGPMAKLEKVVKDALMHRGMTEGEAGNYIRKLRKSTVAADPEEVATRIITHTQRVISEISPEPSTIFRPSEFAPKGRIVEYYDDGRRKYMEVSPNLHDAMTAMNEQTVHWLARLFGVPARMLRKGVTITPEFIARNPWRDQWCAMLNMNLGFRPFVDTTSAVADMLGSKEDYYAWLRSGGAYAGFVELSQPGLKKAVKQLTQSPGRRALRLLNPIGLGEDASQFMERSTRLAAFQRAKQAGQTDTEAAYTSRESTTDYARRGSKMKEVNAVNTFFNAGLQGPERAIRAALADPIGFAIKGMATMTVPSVLLYLHNRKDPEYFELPRWVRDLTYPIKVGDTWVTLPKSFGYGQVFSTIPERFMEYLDKRNPKAFDDLAKTVAESSMPISGDPAGALLPTALQGPIEVTADYEFFRQRDIVPKATEGMLPELQYGPHTSETAKTMGKYVGYSPAKIDHLVRSFLGGSGRYALQGTDMLLRQIRNASGQPVPFEMPKELADMPFVRGFVARDPKRGTGQSFHDFYQDSGDIIAAYQSWRTYIEKGQIGDAQALMNRSPELVLGKELQKARADVNAYFTAIDATMRSPDMTDAAKVAMIRDLEQKRYKTVQQYANLIHAMRKKIRKK